MASDSMENDEVSMVDVLHEDNELEAEANAVLGDSDDQNCTYEKGYVGRQALYACLTCTPAAPEVEPAGICLACSLSCHDGHELVELYTKRNFCCDCGNDKFYNFKCNLTQNKEPSNQLNKYNQNFKGLYCTCKRPYPDPDDEIEDEMIQCILCEDWHHSRHLHNLPPIDGEYSEMICDQCMTKCSFLHAYVQYSVPSQQVCTIKNSDSDAHIDIESIKSFEKSTNPGADSSSIDKPTVCPDNDSNPRCSEEKCSSEEYVDKEKPEKRKLDGNESSQYGETSSKKRYENTSNGNQTDGCVYEKLLGNAPRNEGCTYWKTGWRSHLCKCKTCLAKYDKLDVAYLLDESDTISAYEDRGQTHRAKQSSCYDSGLDALGNLDRVQQMEILHGYNDLKTELKSYLAEFAKEGKTVKEEDIRSFFQNLKNKKSNSGSGNFQHFCR